MSDDVNLNAYLERIGFAGSIAPTLQTLEALHLLHPAAIPFENLDSLVGLPVSLDPARLNHKLLAERRGGYCFEHNTLLLRVLLDLGFTARAHTARVLWGRAQAGVPEPTHMVLSVDIGGTSYLCDVGFGGLPLTAPLKLRSGAVEDTSRGRFRLAGAAPDLTLEVERDADDWRGVYRIDLAEADMATLTALNARVGDAPDWFFREHLLVELTPRGGHRQLVDNRLTIEEGEAREVRTLTSVGELREALKTVFGIEADGLDGLDAALSRLLGRVVAASS